MIVYTSITGLKDNLKHNQNFEGAEFIAFKDNSLPDLNNKHWEFRKPCDLFTDPNRNAKYHKVLAHQLDTDVSLWIDGSITLLRPLHDLVDTFLKDSDICLFKHYKRDCIYDEAEVVKQYKLDYPDRIDAQIDRYKREGYPKKNGLHECTIILRRHTPRIEELNRCWWDEICRGSRRDQLSFDYCCWKLGIKPNEFPLTVYNNLLFNWEKHLVGGQI